MECAGEGLGQAGLVGQHRHCLEEDVLVWDDSVAPVLMVGRVDCGLEQLLNTWLNPAHANITDFQPAT
jgi:hypothetical protein